MHVLRCQQDDSDRKAVVGSIQYLALPASVM